MYKLILSASLIFSTAQLPPEPREAYGDVIEYLEETKKIWIDFYDKEKKSKEIAYLQGRIDGYRDSIEIIKRFPPYCFENRKN